MMPSSGTVIGFEDRDWQPRRNSSRAALRRGCTRGLALPHDRGSALGFFAVTSTCSGSHVRSCSCSTRVPMLQRILYEAGLSYNTRTMDITKFTTGAPGRIIPIAEGAAFLPAPLPPKIVPTMALLKETEEARGALGE